MDGNDGRVMGSWKGSDRNWRMGEESGWSRGRMEIYFNSKRWKRNDRNMDEFKSEGIKDEYD